LLDLITRHKGKFKVTFSLTGIVIDQFRLYAPEVLDSFRKLAQTGMVEFLAETEAHSLAALANKGEFTRQVNTHREMIKEYFGVEPTVFRNTELIYSDQIGTWIADMGFKAMLTEGAKHVLGWKSPNYLYCNAINPRLKLLLRNFVLSDDIAFRFSNRGWSEWPLTTDKYAGWLNKLAPKSEIVNIFLDYETFGEHNWKETGIFDFLNHLPSAILKKTPFRFMTPSEVADSMQPVAPISVPSPISWADEERDITAWLGNELQTAAFEKLYELTDRVNKCDYNQMKKDWIYLQSSDHFYYMCTKFFSDGAVHAYFNPYDTPYDAFMNYMNVLSDFEIRLNRLCPATDEQIEILKLDSQIRAKDELIKIQASEITTLNRKLNRLLPKKTRAAGKTPAKVKPVAAKSEGRSKEVTKTKSLSVLASEALERAKAAAVKSRPSAARAKPASVKSTAKAGTASQVKAVKPTKKRAAAKPSSATESKSGKSRKATARKADLKKGKAPAKKTTVKVSKKVR
jgi:alpha-amylase